MEGRCPTIVFMLISIESTEQAADHCKSCVDQSIEQRAVLTLSFKCLGLKILGQNIIGRVLRYHPQVHKG